MKKIFFVSLLLGALISNFGCRAANEEKSSINNETSKTNNILYAETMSKFEELINSSTPVLVDFYADWCAPCRMMAPILEKVATNLQGDVKIVKVNVDNNREAAMKYGIRSIPTLILFKNGQVKWQGVGVIQADQIESIVKTKGN